MQLRFFNIPVRGDDEAADELNQFLGSQRILAVDRSFVQDGANSAWALCVSCEPAGGRPQGARRIPLASPQANGRRRASSDERTPRERSPVCRHHPRHLGIDR